MPYAFIQGLLTALGLSVPGLFRVSPNHVAHFRSELSREAAKSGVKLSFSSLGQILVPSGICLAAGDGFPLPKWFGQGEIESPACPGWEALMCGCG